MITISVADDRDNIPFTEMHRQSDQQFATNLKVRGYPFLVAKDDESNKAIAYGYLDKFRTNAAYVLSAELSLFVVPEHQESKIGSILLQELLTIAKQMELHTLFVATFTTQQEEFYQHVGFQQVTHVYDAYYLDGRFHDMRYLQYKTQIDIGKDASVPSFIPFQGENYVPNF